MEELLAAREVFGLAFDGVFVNIPVSGRVERDTTD
jgi:hypothetical protein